MKTILYDDTYDGPRWTYGCLHRPVALGAVPAGWIVFGGRAHPAYPFGTIDYPHRLEPQVARQMGLVRLFLGEG